MKKLVTTLIALSALVAIPLSACKVRESEPSHTCTWRIVREPDCTTDGLRERTCNCGKTGDETIPRLGHNCVDGRDDEEHWQKCNRTGCNEERNRERHTFDNDGNCECGYKRTYTASLVFTENADGYAVAGLAEGATDVNIVVPATYSGKPVTAVAEEAFDGSAIESVTLPDSVTEIGNSAFYECAALKTAKLGNGIKTFGDYAFYGSGLTAIETPASAKTFNKGVFYNCLSLKTAKINAAQNIGSYLFTYDAALEKVEFGKGVNVDLQPTESGIFSMAFSGCSALSEIVINGVVKFEKYSFYNNAEASVTITFGDDITEIPANALYPEAWSSAVGDVIKAINIGKNVKKIGDHAFDSCDKVTSLVLPEGVEEIGKVAFSMSGLEEVTLPKSLKSIGIGAFSAPSLKRVNYGGTVDDWVKINFGNNEGANSITCPLSYGADLYIDGSKVTEVVIDGVEEVPAYAFYGCNFVSVTLGETVKRIGQDAFSRTSGKGEAAIGKLVILSKQFSTAAVYANNNFTADVEIFYKGTPEEMLANCTIGASNIHWFKDRTHYFYSETGTEEAYTGASGWTYGGLWHFVDGKVVKW